MIGNRIPPFKFWCQKVLPTVYDDSLSYYEVLNKVTQFLNDVITQMNALTESEETFQQNMSDAWENYSTNLTSEWNTYRTQLTAVWEQYKNYIDTYFNNLDVQEEINNKLDQMALDGTLDALLLPYFNSYKATIDGVVNTQNGRITTLESRMDTFASLPDGSTSGDAELLDIRVPATGFNDDENYPSAGDAVRGQITAVNDVLTRFITKVNVLVNLSGYVNSSGNIIQNTGWFHSDFIPMPLFVRKCKINGVSASAMTFAFYTSDKIFISGIGFAGTIVDDYELLDTQIPNNTAYVVITQKMTEGTGRVIQKYEFVNYEKQEINVLTPNNKFLFVSLDDCTFWSDLITNTLTYSSVFDNSLLSDLRDLHNEYGMKFSLYCFNTDGTNNITDCPTKFQHELQECKDWLKFGFHARESGMNYASGSGGSMETDYADFVTGIMKLTGSTLCIDRCTRLANFAGNLANCVAARDSDCGVLALLTSDDNRDSYYLDTDQNAYMTKHSKYFDSDTQLTFIKTQTRLDGSIDMTPYTTAQYGNFDKALAFFSHETVWGSSVKGRFATLGQWAITNDYSFAYVCDVYK